MDCGERADQFLARCVKFGGLADESAVLAALAAGETVRNHNEDWYSKCRDGDVHAANLAAAQAHAAAKESADKRPMLHCKSCGATGRAGSYPFSTLPGSGCCDDCI